MGILACRFGSVICQFEETTGFGYCRECAGARRTGRMVDFGLS